MKHTHIHTYKHIHAYIHTYIHTYIHIDVFIYIFVLLFILKSNSKRIPKVIPKSMIVWVFNHWPNTLAILPSWNWFIIFVSLKQVQHCTETPFNSLLWGINVQHYTSSTLGETFHLVIQNQYGLQDMWEQGIYPAKLKATTSLDIAWPQWTIAPPGTPSGTFYMVCLDERLSRNVKTRKRILIPNATILPPQGITANHFAIKTRFPAFLIIYSEFSLQPSIS